MKILIFSPTSTPLSLEKNALMGGADTMLLKMIAILEKAGHEVAAYIPVKEIGEIGSAVLHPYETIFETEMEVDLFILYRKMWAIPNNIKYKKAVFYSQDTADTPCFAGVQGKSEALSMFSRIWVLSKFHRDNLLEAFKIPDRKIFILGNAAEPQTPAEKVPLSFIYASTPFRGLDVLLKLWQKIVEKYPDARLDVFSSMKIYGAEELDELHFGKMIGDLKNHRFKNVFYHGSVPQSEVLDCMKTSFMLLYPNVYPETFCNVIMEARACRTPFITTALGSLEEAGGSAGLFIDGNARTEEYQELFLHALDCMIEDPDLYREYQEMCYPIRTFVDYEKNLLNEIKELKD